VRFNGNGTEAPSTPGYDKTLNNPFPYSPATAGKLLDEAGWTARDGDGYRTKDGRRLALRLVYAEDVNATTDDVNLYQVLQAQEKKVGIDVALTPLSASTYWQGGSTQPDGTWDLQQWYDVDRDSDTLVVDAAEGATEGVIASSAPELEGLTAQLSRTTDAAARDRIAAQIQNIIVTRDVAVLGTVPLPVTLAINPKVHGLWLEPDVGEPVLSDAYFAR
jgi:peptide/nickel transport system substrate-binding protein